MLDTVALTKLKNAYNAANKIALFKHSIISGGYVRDTLLGVQPKDIDVIVNMRFDHPDVSWTTSEDKGYDSSVILHVGTYMIDAEHSIEFLVREGLGMEYSDIVDYHYCGLSNGFFDYRGLFLHSSFLADVNEKVVRKSAYCERDTSQGDAYLTRIHQKYPDWELKLEGVQTLC